MGSLVQDAKCACGGERDGSLPSDPGAGWRGEQQGWTGLWRWAGNWGDIWMSHLSVYLYLPTDPQICRLHTDLAAEWLIDFLIFMSQSSIDFHFTHLTHFSLF